MTETTTRPKRRTLHATVVSVEHLTPRMVRVVVGGDDLDGFGAGHFTDHYVKVQLPPAGADYAAPFDAEAIKERLPREQWPRVRSYTVRAWDAERVLLTLDFVVHGDHGVAGPWAAAAQPGDVLQLTGPGGAYTPDPDAAWHLMVGDLAVLPAIAASLQRVAAGVPVEVVVELDDDADRQPLTSPGRLRVTWLRSDGSDRVLLDAVRALEFPEGQVHAFVHGEASAVRAVRKHLVVDRGVPLEALSASGYWKRTRTDEEWRADKAEWNRLAEQDVAG
ncbi:MAG TPA: siderophore-interacting protein [Solirubrobacteraceae bacterium]|nr:siderophore-interacting protein [Solirubrobacteraceae bacterium]